MWGLGAPILIPLQECGVELKHIQMAFLRGLIISLSYSRFDLMLCKGVDN